MPRLHYVDHDFGTKALEVIRQANAIIADYAAQGYDLTLRQLYYQFVSREGSGEWEGRRPVMLVVEPEKK